jgi:hypothetical protein
VARYFADRTDGLRSSVLNHYMHARVGPRFISGNSADHNSPDRRPHLINFALQKEYRMMKITQHLWFERDMKTAIRFYTSLIPGFGDQLDIGYPG